MLLISVLIWVVTLAMQPKDVPTSSVTVPNLVNLTADDAEDALQERGLIPDMREEASVDFDEGRVIRSAPTTGA